MNIIFKTITQFLGRNGMSKCTGINVTKFPLAEHKAEDIPYVTIVPITSKGVIGRSMIQIPFTSLPELIKELQNHDKEISEKQIEQFGKKIVKLLSLKVKPNRRVDTDGGDKTPLGLGRTIIRCLEEAKEITMDIKKKTPIKVLRNGTISFRCSSELYTITDAGGTAKHALKSGFVPLGDGCDYILTETDKKNIRKQLKEMEK